MITQNIYEGIEHIVHISTNWAKNCEECTKWLNNFTEAVNHYLEEHRYKLLHIGSEYFRDIDENAGHQTVAVIGK